MPKYIKIFLLVVVVALVLAVLADLFSNNPQKEGFFTISRGDNVLQIAGNLQSRGYIGSKAIFVLDTVTSGNYRKMKAGRYQIKKGSTNAQLIEKFVKFQSLPVSVSITPGKTTKDIAQILAHAQLANRDEFLSLVSSNSNYPEYSFLADKPKESGLEGYLFPDTYLVDPMAPNQAIVRQILSNFDKKLTEDLRAQIKTQKRTIFEVLTMASILEKEVKTQDDKQTVAGILWKRADNNLPLEVDSTQVDKDVDSPYNTYKHTGLPVGPICNPGLDSVKAAINFKNSDYWFYLSAPDGETIFAKTLGQHLINKAKYLTN